MPTGKTAGKRKGSSGKERVVVVYPEPASATRNSYRRSGRVEVQQRHLHDKVRAIRRSLPRCIATRTRVVTQEEREQYLRGRNCTCPACTQVVDLLRVRVVVSGQ